MLYTAITSITIAILVLIWKLGIIAKLYDKWTAWAVILISAILHDALDKPKRNLFMDCHSTAKKSPKPLKVLDIGTGTGPNFEYQPKGCEWICFEPNKNYDDELYENARKYLEPASLEVIHEYATDLKMFEDNTFDIVETTLLFCSVDETEQLLNTIKRVLKPGGKLYYVEHTKAEDGSWLFLMQKIVDLIWPKILDGCHITKSTWMAIDTAGFSEVKYERFCANVPLSMFLVSPVLVGTAIK